MRRICVALLSLVVVAVLAGPATAAITVSLDSPPVTTSVGHRFTFTTTVANAGASAVSDLVAHLNVLSDDPGTYVDPEDWSSHRTQYLPAIPPNGEQKLTWTVQAVNSGNLTVFVSVLPRHESGTVLIEPAPPSLRGPAPNAELQRRPAADARHPCLDRPRRPRCPPAPTGLKPGA